MTTSADAKVSSLIDRHLASSNVNDESSDTDALFAELEAEDDSSFRAARAQQLASQLSKSKPAANITRNIGDIYTTLKSNEEVLRFTTENDKCVLHFLHPDFARCMVMDAHLMTLGQQHVDHGGVGGAVMFARVDVKDAGFVVEKLGVRVLPAVIGFVGGVTTGRIVGFEGVSWGGKEEGMQVTREIEKVLLSWGVLERRLLLQNNVVVDDHSDSEEEIQRLKAKGKRGIRGGTQRVGDDDDADWD